MGGLLSEKAQKKKTEDGADTRKREKATESGKLALAKSGLPAARVITWKRCPWAFSQRRLLTVFDDPVSSRCFSFYLPFRVSLFLFRIQDGTKCASLR
jgi:hypothetical protein